MNFTTQSEPLQAAGDDLPELELNDEDILDAMRHIPGFWTSAPRTFARSTIWLIRMPWTAYRWQIRAHAISGADGDLGSGLSTEGPFVRKKCKVVGSQIKIRSRFYAIRRRKRQLAASSKGKRLGEW